MNILIVESAAKARTLGKYLGPDWRVMETGGHIKGLPDRGKAYWANRPGELPEPPWTWTDRGQDKVNAILGEATPDTTFWIATDPDREGEFIAWCLDRILSEQGPTHRVTFDEVTEEAVKGAIQHPRSVDKHMVDAALVRSFLDRLVGFRTSKMAQSFLGRRSSMGRVQTPTLGFVVERELEREAHVPIPYFEVRATAADVEFKARFHEPEDAEAWRNESGKFDAARTFDAELARTAFEAITDAGRLEITGIRPTRRALSPKEPFSTDALLQAAGSRFGWSPRKTSAIASHLYESGHITYVRTDSTRLAESAVAKARMVITEDLGTEYLGTPVREGTLSSLTQDAHEAIRPTRLALADPGLEDADAGRLYRLVRAHTLASQMASSIREGRSLDAACEGSAHVLSGNVSWRTFAGWEAVYDEFLATPATAPPDVPLEAGAVWTLDPATGESPNPRLIEDETKPAPRFRPHTVIAEMKKCGIGRPSTYASTVEKLEQREYVRLEDGALVPTDRGRTVWLDVAPLYAQEHDGEAESEVELFSTEFTAAMEEGLDHISKGSKGAPSTWEEWREQIRDLHEVARRRRNEGGITPRQKSRLLRLLANAPDMDVPDVGALSSKEARELIAKLLEAGVPAAPSEKQLAFIASLIEDLSLEDEEVSALSGGAWPDKLRTSAEASALIDELKRLLDERRPSSSKQLRYIESLAEKLGISEGEAATLVGATSFEDLTGGRDGTASELIDILNQRVEAEKVSAPRTGSPTDGEDQQRR